MTLHAYIAHLRNAEAAPASFVRHQFTRSFRANLALEEVWDWLNDPATFIKGQVWPWRVEFIGGGMEPGVLCNHTGPLMNFPGMVGEVRPRAYRDLRYFYGAYAISHRLVRPRRLQFWTCAHPGGGTEVRLAVDAFVHRRFAWVWTRIQKLFWARFPRWMGGGVGRNRRRRRNAALSHLPCVNARMPATRRAPTKA